MKECKECGVVKELIFFSKRKNAKDGFNYNCKQCDSILNHEYNINNKETIKNRRKKHYDCNKIRLNTISKKYYVENKEKANLVSKKYFKENKTYKSNYRKNRKLKDPLYDITEKIRKCILSSFYSKGFRKNTKTEIILGCSFAEFKIYLESKFEIWMNWNNRGLFNGELNYGWDIDHIIPLDSAKTEEEIIKLNHYTNLQPLCGFTNRHIKINKVDYYEV